MKTSFRPTRFPFAELAMAAALALALAPATADTTEISPVPLGTASSVTVLPNLMFILDDSGSMQWHFMPDNVNLSNTDSCKPYRRNTGGDVDECAAATFVAGNLPDDDDVTTVSPKSDGLRHDRQIPDVFCPVRRPHQRVDHPPGVVQELAQLGVLHAQLTSQRMVRVGVVLAQYL